MRLLQVHGTDEVTFTFTKDYTEHEEIPPYAILSHTWEEGQEVSYEDVLNGTGKNKTGYKKIQFCAQQTKKDGYSYFWVDTCCIKKSNSAELEVALNSMFRWYQNSAKCYVYLSDVSRTQDKTSIWDPAFQKSRWFTRGWTLQELLAPISVEFFSREQVKLGDKRSLEKKICNITNIPCAALQGARLSEFTNEERFKWMHLRETKLDEDKAYALLGIFGVEMPLRYGEGLAGASQRLEKEIEKLNDCLREMRITDPRDDKKRIEAAKGGLLRDSYRWILDTPEFNQWCDDRQGQLLWVKGDPGKGKTMLMCGVIDELQKSMPKTTLLSYFFCQAADSTRNNATAVLRGLLYLIIKQQPILISHIRQKYNDAGGVIFRDTNSWFAVSDIFINILRDPKLNDTLLVVDALDECQDDMQKLLEFISQESRVSSRVKWIVSSRNWPIIEQKLDTADHKVRLQLELNQESVSMAVDAYICYKVAHLASEKRYDEKTKNTVEDYMKLNAEGTFLWVALVCQDLADPRVQIRHTLKRLRSFPPGLDGLYKRMLEHIDQSLDAVACREILALLLTVFCPIELWELRNLSGTLEEYDNDSLSELIKLCGSFLTLQDNLICFVHQSVKDYLLEMAHENIFPSGIAHQHRAVYLRSLRVLSSKLREEHARNIFQQLMVDFPSIFPELTVTYPSVYWVDHLEQSFQTERIGDNNDLQDDGIVTDFLQDYDKMWLDILMHLRSKSVVKKALHKLRALARSRSASRLMVQLDLAGDHVRRLSSIRRSPNIPLGFMNKITFNSQDISHSKLIGDESGRIRTVQQRSDFFLRSRISTIWCEAISPDGRTIASAYDDHTVRFWDVTTGVLQLTLEGHGVLTTAVAYSPDGKTIATLSPNYIKLWDAETGAHQHTLYGVNHFASRLVFSPDGKTLASFYNCTTHLWDATSGTHLVHFVSGSPISTKTFSPDGKTIASASFDMSINLWNAATGAYQKTLQRGGTSLPSIFFSPDGKTIASASDDGTIQLLDAATGTHQKTLERDGRVGDIIAFSPDGQIIASASNDNTIRLWYTTTGVLQEIFEGFIEVADIGALAFSADSETLVVVSEECEIYLLDVSTTSVL